MKKIITIIEDNEDQILILKRILEAVGYRTIGVQNGNEALESLRENPPHLILLDIMLPGKNGIELLKEVRSEPALSQIPVLMLSAVQNKLLIQQVMQLNIEGYILKPINRDIILDKIRMVLTKNSLQNIRYQVPDHLQEASIISRGAIMGLGESKIEINSDLSFIKGAKIKMDSELWRKLGIKNEYMKAIRSSRVTHLPFRFKTECSLSGATEIELQNIRQWANMNTLSQRNKND